MGAGLEHLDATPIAKPVEEGGNSGVVYPGADLLEGKASIRASGFGGFGAAASATKALDSRVSSRDSSQQSPRSPRAPRVGINELRLPGSPVHEQLLAGRATPPLDREILETALRTYNRLAERARDQKQYDVSVRHLRRAVQVLGCSGRLPRARQISSRRIIPPYIAASAID